MVVVAIIGFREYLHSTGVCDFGYKHYLKPEMTFVDLSKYGGGGDVADCKLHYGFVMLM